MAFALHLLRGIRPELFEAGEWEFFTQTTPAILENKVSLPKWAPFERKDIFNTFCTALTKLSNSINFNDKEFETWFADQSPEAALPASCRKLSSFQKVLLVQIFKPERLQSSVNAFLMEAYGLTSLAGISYSFKTIHAESTEDVPILFIVSPGYDPSKELEEFCNEKVGKDNYKQLSMGGGQNDQALKILKEAADQGHWVCFKNLHLVTSWLPTLEKQFKAVKKHSNFRLFLTT
jgi:dynein heavy chain 2